MKTTLTLHWKALVSKIHPPLPLTPRDSQRVLRLLNASFQQHLDSHHPTKEDHYTNGHLRSILSSPLILNTAPRSKNTLEGTGISKQETAVQNEASVQDPVTIMRDLISKGSATLETIKKCLTAQLKRSSATADPMSSMKDSNAGAIALHWLWSTGMASSLKFLPDHHFTQTLIKFLVAEGQYNKIYSWLDLDYKKLQKVKSTEDPKRIQGRIILELTKAETMFGGGLSSALNTFTKLLYEWHSVPRKPWAIRNTFSPSGKYLMKTMEARKKTKTLNTSDYDNLQRSAKFWCKEDTFERAWIALHHPEHPNADLTLPYLQNLSPKTLTTMSRKRRTDTADLSLQAAERLLSQDRRADVARIMKVLKVHFPQEIGHEAFVSNASSTRKSPTPLQEGDNVQLLGSLALG